MQAVRVAHGRSVVACRRARVLAVTCSAVAYSCNKSGPHAVRKALSMLRMMSASVDLACVQPMCAAPRPHPHPKPPARWRCCLGLAKPQHHSTPPTHQRGGAQVRVRPAVIGILVIVHVSDLGNAKHGRVDKQETCMAVGRVHRNAGQVLLASSV